MASYPRAIDYVVYALFVVRNLKAQPYAVRSTDYGNMESNHPAIIELKFS